MVFNDGMEYPILKSVSISWPAGLPYLKLCNDITATIFSIIITNPKPDRQRMLCVGSGIQIASDGA